MAETIKIFEVQFGTKKPKVHQMERLVEWKALVFLLVLIVILMFWLLITRLSCLFSKY